MFDFIRVYMTRNGEELCVGSFRTVDDAKLSMTGALRAHGVVSFQEVTQGAWFLKLNGRTVGSVIGQNFDRQVTDAEMGDYLPSDMVPQ